MSSVFEKVSEIGKRLGEENRKLQRELLDMEESTSKQNDNAVRKAWQDCIRKANEFYRNIKHEVESGRDNPKTEQLGDEFQEANKVLADCIVKEHKNLCENWTYGERTRYRWNKEQEDIMQTRFVGFDISVKIIDFTLHDEFMIYYDNAIFVYKLDGDNLKFVEVK